MNKNHKALRLTFSFLLLLSFAVVTLHCSSGDSRDDKTAPLETSTDEPDSEAELLADTGGEFIYQGAIPKTCEEIELNKDDPEFGSTVGCQFYPVILENGEVGKSECAFVVANVQQDRPAEVTFYKGSGLAWFVLAKQKVEPMQDFKFKLPCNGNEDTPESGYIVKGAHKIVSDTPIAAYQFNPEDGATSFSSDASLLIPTTNLDTYYEVVGWDTVNTREDTDSPLNVFLPTYFVVAATTDGTTVTVIPSVSPEARGLVPGTGEPFEIQMNEGDVFYVWGDDNKDNFTGTTVQSNEGHPVAVFSGSRMSYIPGYLQAADHIEEQMVSPRYWGTKFVASRMPARDPAMNPAEPVLWQIYVKEDNTQVTLTAAEGVNGLPFDTKVLNAKEQVQFFVDGTAEQPGDFYVTTSDATQSDNENDSDSDSEVGEPKPIVLMQYMTAAQMIAPELINEPISSQSVLGDPAMVYVSPVEQFLPHYVVYVPDTWGSNVLIITRKRSAPVLLDGELLEHDLFKQVPGTSYVVGRIPVSREMHTVKSTNPEDGFGVIVVGWNAWDSYAYTGGMGMAPLTSPL